MEITIPLLVDKRRNKSIQNPQALVKYTNVTFQCILLSVAAYMSMIQPDKALPNAPINHSETKSTCDSRRIRFWWN